MRKTYEEEEIEELQNQCNTLRSRLEIEKSRAVKLETWLEILWNCETVRTLTNERIEAAIDDYFKEGKSERFHIKRTNERHK